jgi:pimeloyl-ACP methyl ester carboxylesterase
MDGTRLSGWWIPATQTQRTDVRHPAQAWGRRTVILCHGFGADKAADLRLVRDLVPNGYNVFAFDFRAHGQSAGQLTTFGNLERNDVLGAVRWVKAQHPQQTEKVFGLGESMGAAALLGAAAEESIEGQSIDAVAVYAPFDRLTTVLQGVAAVHYAPAAGWLAARVGLPIASAQLGARMAGFSPAKAVQALWPRPILVLASDEDRGVDVRRCRALFEEALQPKYRYWAEKGSRESILFADDEASLTVRIFFETSRSIL